MLRIVQTPFGANQEQALAQLITKSAPNELVLLVPEQFSFENERLLFETLGAQKMMQAQVLSFKRLAHQVFRAFGGLAGEYVTDASRNVLMALALDEVSLELTLYKKSSAHPAFVQKLCEMAAELKNAAVQPQDLLDAQQDGLLGQKLTELSYVFQAYDALLSRGYHDPADDLTRAARLLQEHPEFFQNKTVFLRAFSGFTQSELLVLAQMLKHAQEVFVLLDSNDIFNRQSEVDRAINHTATRLMGLCRRLGVAVAPVVCIPRQSKQDEALDFLAQNLFGDGDKIWEKETPAIGLVQANDPYEEVAYVCASICQMVRQKHLRFRDIAIIARDLAPYAQILTQMGARYHLPLFMDAREEVLHKPLMLFVSCALNIVANSWQMDDILSYLRCELLGFTPYEIALFENYAYIWNLKGASLKEPFFLHPSGLKGEFSPEDWALLAQLENMRLQIMPPLETLRRALLNADGEGFARALYAFLCECRIGERCEEKSVAHKSAGNVKDGEDYLRTWELLCETLETVARLLKGVHKPPTFFVRVMQLLFANLDLGNIPQTADQVLVGTADRVRVDCLKAVFVLGANEGVFPAVMGNYGLLTTEERRRMIEAGVPLTFDADMEEFIELSYAYKTLLSASECLVVCYPRFDAKGGALAPSRIVGEIERLFAHVRPVVCSEQPLQLVQNAQTAMAAFARCFFEDTPQRATLKHLLTAQKQTIAQVQALQKVSASARFQMQQQSAIEASYGQALRLSPSRVESFHRCRFAYFLRYAMGLKERKKAELSPIETGSVIHYVLEQVLKTHTPEQIDTMDKQSVMECIQAILEKYLHEQMGGKTGKGERFAYLFNRLKDTAYKLVRHLVKEFLQSDFSPFAFEMDLTHSEYAAPLHVQTPDGRNIFISGYVDRVDVMEKDGRKYVRVIDYKTGTKSFKLADVFYGLNMQMLLYLFAIWQNGREKLQNAFPAGILYLPAHNPITTAAREQDAQSIMSQNAKSLRMNGLVLNDPEVIAGMEKHAQGLYIPVKLKKDGTPDAYSSVCSLAKMGVLKRRVEATLCEMASRMFAGDIAAIPVDGSDYKPCGYCEYASVCLHTEEDEVRALGAVNEQEWLKEEENDA